MTRVFYGGGPGQTNAIAGDVEIKVVKTILCSRVPIYDGPTRLYDEWTFECIGIINPRTMSYAIAAGEGTPPAVAGQRATRTDDAIRHFLLNPRRHWRITVGNDVLLETPDVGRTCDAHAGPKPYKCEIMQIWGLQTMVVRWGCQAYINPCVRINNGTITPILSHRWTQERNVDQDSYATLMTRGHAIFDTARMAQLRAVPDDFWELMARPLEENFKRLNVQVSASINNDELEYTIVDREMPINLVHQSIARAQVTHTANVFRGGLEAAGKSFGRSLLNIDLTRPLAFLNDIFSSSASIIPQLRHVVNVKLWATRYGSRNILRQRAREIIACRLNNVGFTDKVALFSDVNTTVAEDVTGRYVEVTTDALIPMLTSVVNSFSQSFGEGFEIMQFPFMPNTENVGTNRRGDNILTNADAANVPLAGGDQDKGGTRGTWLGYAAAQALTRPCQRQKTQERGKKVQLNLTGGKGMPDKGGFEE